MLRFLTFSLSLLSLSTGAQNPSKTPSKKHFWHSMETTATPAAVWKVWTQVDNWHTWDTGLRSATLKSDSFGLGTRGVITSLEGRKSKFKVVDYQEGQSYTFKTALPLGGLYVKRSWKEENGKTVFTHEVWFSGLTGGLFAKLLGNDFREMLPGVLEKVKEQAEAMP